MQTHPNGLANTVWWIVTITSCLSAFGGVMWSIWIIRAYRREKRWLTEGRCLNCGYDLRQSKDRCPECGKTVIPSDR